MLKDFATMPGVLFSSALFEQCKNCYGTDKEK